MTLVTWNGHDPSASNEKKYGAKPFHQQPIRMCQWIAQALDFAIEHGWHPKKAVTSGYRPGRDPHTSTGVSNHQGTEFNNGQTPCGAIDFGGFEDPVAKETKDDFIRTCHEHGYTGHIPVAAATVGYRDDGHCSCNGH